MSWSQEGPPPVPQGDYIAAKRHGPLIYTAGMTPRRGGVMMFFGPVLPGQVTEQNEAVTMACANALRAAEATLAAGEEIAAILTMTIYVAAPEGFSEHSKVADFASAFLRERLGEDGVCSRCVIGVSSLPGHAPVEIQLIAAV